MQIKSRQNPMFLKRKSRGSRVKTAVMVEAALLLAVVVFLFGKNVYQDGKTLEVTGDGFIKWVDFNVSYEALCKAYTYDVDTYGQPVHLDWVDLLAYVAAKNGGDFSAKSAEEIGSIAEKILAEETTIEKAAAGLKNYSYYREAYRAVLGGFVGEYEMQEKAGGEFVKKYGLKAFSPVAKGFEYSDYDDFGVSRSYGYRRQHLGHDMMGQVGTPIIAVESGYVEALGWNQYGGWRIGIRSFDGKRYYYYAHLRQNYPY